MFLFFSCFFEKKIKKIWWIKKKVLHLCHQGKESQKLIQDKVKMSQKTQSLPDRWCNWQHVCFWYRRVEVRALVGQRNALN